MDKSSELSGRRRITGGVFAGVIGGAVIAIFMLAVSIVKGQDVWSGMKMAGAPFLGERAMLPGFDLGAVLVGVLSHFAVSIVWGVLFGILFHGLGKPATVAVGAIYGIVVWLGMFYVVLPLFGLSEIARSAPVGMAVLEHVLFGLAVGVGFLPFQRRRPHAPPSTQRPAVSY